MIQKKEIEARIGMTLSLTETPFRVMLQYEKKPSDIFIEKMTPEKWWFLLVQKNVGETCIFESHKVGKKLKCIPLLECEDVKVPEETFGLLEIISNSQKRKHEIHEFLTSLIPQYNEARRKFMRLLEIGKEKRNGAQNYWLVKHKENKKSLEDKINKCRHIIAECDMIITDLTVELKRR